MRDPCGDGNVLDLDCININILAEMLQYSFGRSYHWGESGRGYV